MLSAGPHHRGYKTPMAPGEADKLLAYYLGKPYYWGGGHGAFSVVDRRGYDCSGWLRIAAFFCGTPWWMLSVDRTAHDWFVECRSNALWSAFKSEDSASGILVAFYGTTARITHCVPQWDGTDWISASGTKEGGGSIRRVGGHDYRSDLVAVHRIPATRAYRDLAIRGVVSRVVLGL